MFRRPERVRRGSVSIEQVALIAIVLPLAGYLLGLSIRALIVTERFLVEVMTGPMP